MKTFALSVMAIAAFAVVCGSSDATDPDPGPPGFDKPMSPTIVQNGKILNPSTLQKPPSDNQGYLGIAVNPNFTAHQIPYGSGQVLGLDVLKIAPDSPAEKAGILIGDSIVPFGAPRQFNDHDGFTNFIRSSGSGNAVRIGVWHQGELHNVKVVLGTALPAPSAVSASAAAPLDPNIRPSAPEAPVPAPSSQNLPSDNQGFLGVHINPNPTIHVVLGPRSPETPSAVSGLNVYAISPNGPAEKAGILVGDAIVAINEQHFKTHEDFINLIRHTVPSTTILIELWRRGKLYNVTAALGNRPPPTVTGSGVVNRLPPPSPQALYEMSKKLESLLPLATQVEIGRICLDIPYAEGGTILKIEDIMHATAESIAMQTGETVSNYGSLTQDEFYGKIRDAINQGKEIAKKPGYCESLSPDDRVNLRHLMVSLRP